MGSQLKCSFQSFADGDQKDELSPTLIINLSTFDMKRYRQKSVTVIQVEELQTPRRKEIRMGEETPRTLIFGSIFSIFFVCLFASVQLFQFTYERLC